jgi:hypothetical protein
LNVLKKIISMRPTAPPALAVGKNSAVAAPKPASTAHATGPVAADAPKVDATATAVATTWDDVVDAALAEMTPAEIKGATAYIVENANNVPNELDGKVLARCKAKLGHYLDDESRKRVRRYLRQRLKEATARA